MKTLSRLLAVLAALGMGPAWCADAQLGVTANVGTTCSFTEVPMHMGFPEIDPSGSQVHVVTSVVRVRCTNGTRLNLSIDGAPRSPVVRDLSTIPFLGSVTAHLPYTLSWTTTSEPTGGFSAAAADFVVTLTGTLTPAQYQDAAAGHYDDRLTLQLSP